MTVPRRFIDNYTDAVNTVSETNREALSQALRNVDYSDMTQAANNVVSIMERHCSLAANESGRLAQTFYRGMSTYQTGSDFDAKVYTGRKSVATEKATRGIFQKAVDGDWESYETQLLDRLDYEVKKAAGHTVAQNARHDRRRPRFARVPSGHETCPWCVMLASRGPVYWSAESAGEENHYHANCDCRIVPVWDSISVRTENGGIVRRGGEGIEGYDPDAYFAEYLDMLSAGKHFKSENRWDTVRDISTMGKSRSAQKRDLVATRKRSVRYLSDATSYTDFMQRVKDVNDEWATITPDDMARSQFAILQELATDIRKRYLE